MKNLVIGATVVGEYSVYVFGLRGREAVFPCDASLISVLCPRPPTPQPSFLPSSASSSLGISLSLTLRMRSTERLELERRLDKGSSRLLSIFPLLLTILEFSSS